MGWAWGWVAVGGGASGWAWGWIAVGGGASGVGVGNE